MTVVAALYGRAVDPDIALGVAFAGFTACYIGWLQIQRTCCENFPSEDDLPKHIARLWQGSTVVELVGSIERCIVVAKSDQVVPCVIKLVDRDGIRVFVLG